jgi:hypothetical protein
MLEQNNRTSDDSGLTSDETSDQHNRQHRIPPTSLSLYQQQKPGTSSSGESSSASSSGAENHHSLTTTAITINQKQQQQSQDLMTQSTSAILMKKSPRQLHQHQQQRRPNGFPKTQLNNFRNIPAKNDSTAWLPESSLTATTAERENQSPSTTDSSPWEEKPKAPIPTPRKKQNQQPVTLRHIERDSLNSYAGEDDYGEYEEDDDELFDEIIDESPISINRPTRADYVNLSDFCVVKDSSSTTNTNHVYSDIIKVAPEIPKHQPLIQFEQKLFRTAEKCLSIIGTLSGDENTATASTSDSFSHSKFLRASDSNNSCRNHPTSSSAGSLPSRESNPDSGLGRCSSERAGSNGVKLLPEILPECMVLAHPPQDSSLKSRSHCSMISNSSEYACPPDASRYGTMKNSPRRELSQEQFGLSRLRTSAVNDVSTF